MDPARLLQLCRARLQPRVPRLLRPRTPVGQRRALRVSRLGNALLAVTLAPRCAACASVLDSPLDGPVCARCWAAARAASGQYQGPLRDIIHAFKYEGRRTLAAPLGVLLRDGGIDLLDDAACVVPV